MRRIRRNHGQSPETKIRHGASRRANIQGIARGHQDDFDLLALGLGEQIRIVFAGIGGYYFPAAADGSPAPAASLCGSPTCNVPALPVSQS